MKEKVPKKNFSSLTAGTKPMGFRPATKVGISVRARRLAGVFRSAAFFMKIFGSL